MVFHPRILAVVAGLLLPAACLFEETKAPQSGTRDGMSVQNEERTLADRLTERDEEIVFEEAAATLDRSASRHRFSMNLIAEIAPPEVNGQKLQATSVHLDAGFAYISYNLRGETHGGGVDIVQIRAGRNAVIRSSVVYDDANVHSVYFDKDLFLATGTSSPQFSAPAVLERMRIQGGRLVLADHKRTALNSFAATSVFAARNEVYAVSGNTGGLHALSSSDLESKEFVSLDDARWVDFDGERIVVAQGMPGRVTVIDPVTFSSLNQWEFSGADIPESKTTVRVLGGKALVAAGSGGLKLIHLGTGKLLGSVPVPVVPGLDPELTVANAADADGDLIYVSHGEAGVYAIHASSDLSSDTGENEIALEVLGKLRFDDLESVNHVAFDGQTLVIAAGLGGVKIVSVTNR